MRVLSYCSFLTLLMFQGCIGDDIIFDTVAESIRITNAIDTLGLDDSFTFEAMYLNNIGEEETVEVIWSSSDTSVVTIDDTGLAYGKSIGTTMIEAKTEIPGQEVVKDQFILQVVEGETGTGATQRTGELRTTSSYQLEGAFILKQEAGDLVLSLSDSYRASSSLPGLYVYLANNPNTTNNALEISKVTVFNGAHSYSIPEGVDLNTYQYVLYYCKPFNVKVGDGEFME